MVVIFISRTNSFERVLILLARTGTLYLIIPYINDAIVIDRSHQMCFTNQRVVPNSPMKGSAVAQFKSQEISRHFRLLPQSYALQPYYENELNLSEMCLSFLTHSIDILYSNVCPPNNTSRPDPARPTRPDMTRLDRPGPRRSDPAVLKTEHQPARPTRPFPPFSSLRRPCRL